jgi:hypothetical protein
VDDFPAGLALSVSGLITELRRVESRLEKGRWAVT